MCLFWQKPATLKWALWRERCMTDKFMKTLQRRKCGFQSTRLKLLYMFVQYLKFNAASSSFPRCFFASLYEPKFLTWHHSTSSCSSLPWALWSHYAIHVKYPVDVCAHVIFFSSTDITKFFNFQFSEIMCTVYLISCHHIFWSPPLMTPGDCRICKKN